MCRVEVDTCRVMPGCDFLSNHRGCAGDVPGTCRVHAGCHCRVMRPWVCAFHVEQNFPPGECRASAGQVPGKCRVKMCRVPGHAGSCRVKVPDPADLQHLPETALGR